MGNNHEAIEKAAYVQNFCRNKKRGVALGLIEERFNNQKGYPWR